MCAPPGPTGPRRRGLTGTCRSECRVRDTGQGTRGPRALGCDTRMRRYQRRYGVTRKPPITLPARASPALPLPPSPFRPSPTAAACPGPRLAFLHVQQSQRLPARPGGRGAARRRRGPRPAVSASLAGRPACAAPAPSALSVTAAAPAPAGRLCDGVHDLMLDGWRAPAERFCAWAAAA